MMELFRGNEIFARNLSGLEENLNDELQKNQKITKPHLSD
jgi:hypothetical protein